MREAFLEELLILQKEQSQVKVSLISDSASTGRTLAANFVACDTNFTHVLLKNLETPTGIQPNVLLRLNDVISISYQ